MLEDEQRYTWKATGVNGHREVMGSDFLYTSDSAPIEADEYERQRQRAETAERDLALAVRNLELADENTELRIAQLTQRAEAAEAQLAVVSGLSEWRDLPELPSHVGHYLAFWKEDGVWVAQYWPGGIEDESGHRGHWLTTPDGSIRQNPVAWRHLPSVPDRYVIQDEYFRA